MRARHGLFDVFVCGPGLERTVGFFWLSCMKRLARGRDTKGFLPQLEAFFVVFEFFSRRRLSVWAGGQPAFFAWVTQAFIAFPRGGKVRRNRSEDE